MDYQAQEMRERHIRRLGRFLARHNAPRTEMSLIVLLTGAAGLLVSVALLHAGLHAMWLRYGLSVLAAYAVFLLLVKIWLEFHRPTSRIRENDRPDALELCQTTAEGLPYLPSDGPNYGVADIVDIDSWEILAYLALGAATLSLFASSAYVVWIAPEFFGEVLLDGVLTLRVYRRLRQTDMQHWTVGVFRRTAFPALLVLTTFMIAGGVMQVCAPHAQTIGQVLAQLTAAV